MAKTFYVTTPIYYASGRPHIGHAFATLYADVLARYHRLLKEDTFFLTGMDEHGTKIAQQAEKEDQVPQVLVDELAKVYQEVWSKLNFSNDDFIRTTSQKHEVGVTEFVQRLTAVEGAIYQADYEGLYCTGCENFVTEKDLDERGECPDHHTKPTKLKEQNYFFNLKKYLPAVKDLITSGKLEIIPESRKNEILRMIEDDIPDFSISRQHVKWGIPWPKDPKQTIYVWADALSNYITALDYPDGELYKKFWPADLHVIGVEINKFHSIYWPAMLLALGLPTPKKIFAHGLFTVNGQKMSKTVGNVIDPLKMIDQFGVDATRYLLLSQFSAYYHGDIKEEEFVTKYNDDLAKGVGNLFQRTTVMIQNYLGGKTSEETDEKVTTKIMSLAAKYHQEMQDLKLFEALHTVMSIVTVLDQYIDTTKPWELNKEKKTNQLQISLNTVHNGLSQIALLLQPFMPNKMAAAEQFLQALSSDEKPNLFPRLN